jgi:hypothetical protein
MNLRLGAGFVCWLVLVSLVGLVGPLQRTLWCDRCPAFQELKFA